MHWAMQYLNQPWVAHDNDCWAFFCRVQRERFGRIVPDIEVDAANVMACVRAFTGHGERQNWIETQTPAEGDAVLLSQGRQPTHVGLWVDVDGGGVLHCVQGAGVIFSRPQNLLLIGYNMLASYRPRVTA